MNNHLFWMIVVAVFLSACSEQPAPSEPDEAQATAPVSEAAEPAEAMEADEPAEAKYEFSDEFVDEMHANADHMDEMMFALADGDLEAAKTAAHLLSRQKTVNEVQEEWQPYIDGMREAAVAVANAEDIDTARTAAETITGYCQDCHETAGVLVE